MASSTPARLAAARAHFLLALVTCLALAFALGLSGLTHRLERALQPASGLSLEILRADPRAPARPVGTVDLPEMPSSRDRELPRFQRHVRFRGHWKIDRAGRYAIRLQADGEASLRVDDILVAEREVSSNSRTAHGVLELAEGPHRLEIDYRNAAPPHQLHVRAGLLGEAVVALDPLDLSIERPPGERVEKVARARRLARAARLAWSTTLALAVALLVLRRRDWIPLARRAAPRARLAVPILIVAWAAALRFESLVVRYWQPEAPWWASELAERVSTISPRQGLPRWVEEGGYSGDPINYIRFGRSLQGFYDAHVREPVFVALTRAGLALAGDRDLGVSFASAFASTLLVAATYLLGRRVYGAPVGVLAAAALAVDRHVIELSSMGWRDDTFALFVVLSAYSWLRLYDRPSFPNALLAGLSSGAAVLTRITALSFVLPVAAYVAAAGSGNGRARLERWTIAVVVLGAVIAPYLLTCAIAFGDPLYSINYHMHYYGHGLDGQEWSPAQRWTDLVFPSEQPLARLRAALIGLTSYPFTNKWQTFERWWPTATLVLQVASVLGLLRLAVSRRGALVVLALLGSLLPYAFTWDTEGGGAYRFTLHAYPFYLAAGFGTLAAVASWLGRKGSRTPPSHAHSRPT